MMIKDKSGKKFQEQMCDYQRQFKKKILIFDEDQRKNVKK